MASEQSSVPEAGFLSGGGEMGELMRAHSWGPSLPGPTSAWSQALRTAIRLILNSGHPMYVFWGPELLCFYNDAYRASIGPERHPTSLGQPARLVWEEIWPVIGPQIDQVMSGQGATWNENQLIPITRNGRQEAVYWTYSYSPIDEPESPRGVGGVLVVCSETTASVLAEHRRQQETVRQRRLFDQAPGFIIVMNGPQHIVEFVNEAHRALFGSEDWAGKPIREAFPDVASQGFFELLDRVYATGEPHHAHGASARFRRPSDGRDEARVLDFVYSALLDDAGAICGVFCEGIDVTEQRRIQAALRHSEEQLRLATEAAEVGLWDVDMLNDRLYWTARVKAMFGISAEAPVSMADFYAGLHPDDRDRVTAAFAAAADSTQRLIYAVEYRTLGKEDGILRWLAAKGRGQFDAQGRCVRVIGTVVDITERKLDEERLRQSEARLRRAEAALQQVNETLEAQVATRTAERDRVWRNSRDLLVIVGADGIFRAVSPSWTNILGHHPDEVVGRRFETFVWPHDAEPSQAAPAAAAVPTDVADFESRFRHRDGTPRWIAWRTSVEEGVVFAYGRDITADKERDEQFAKVQEALRQAQKMEAIGQLTGGIAHDFNNLLQGVAGNFELIRRKPEAAAKVCTWAEAGLRAVERGAKLTGQLLAFSRSQKLELRPLDVAALVTGMHDLLSRTLGPAVRISFDLESKEHAVLGDETQLEMALLNLAINARDAIPPSGGELRITSRRRVVQADAELASGDYVVLSVSDTGSGMAPDTIARAFDPFFTTKGVGKGTGLGLSQVYGMMRQAGGGVRIDSELGAGTTVHLYLPCTEEPRASITLDDSQPTHAVDAPHRATTVLVVDDDADVRRFLVDSLETLGYDTIDVEDGVAGIAAVERSAPDVVIVDFAMPGMNGAEVAREIRMRHPRLPIIFASGFADTAAIAELPGRTPPILRKPFRIDELNKLLDESLGQPAGA